MLFDLDGVTFTDSSASGANTSAADAARRDVPTPDIISYPSETIVVRSVRGSRSAAAVVGAALGLVVALVGLAFARAAGRRQKQQRKDHPH
jgi:hypothetical protein